ncbi:MAG: Non-canonical purine NTP pyrophosphatase [Chlamydiae bacterium]|nr:Non-canonical purine NTP pyrophosphatase [Chlamydiota bacterium]
MDLVLATRNAHKVRELRSLLKILHGIDLYSLRDFPEYTPPLETGDSFEHNARGKAANAARRLEKWTLADDSGIVVPALGGSPGILSARYAGEGAGDKENRNKLLKEMASLEGIARSAYFECVLALASPDGEIYKVVHGICEGEILTEVRGGNGFGYDPLFRKYEYSQTFAELDEMVKNQVSHRAKAIEKLLFSLESLILKEEQSIVP